MVQFFGLNATEIQSLLFYIILLPCSCFTYVCKFYLLPTAAQQLYMLLHVSAEPLSHHQGFSHSTHKQRAVCHRMVITCIHITAVYCFIYRFKIKSDKTACMCVIFLSVKYTKIIKYKKYIYSLFFRSTTRWKKNPETKFAWSLLSPCYSPEMKYAHISCWHSGNSVHLNFYLSLTFKENQYMRFRTSRLQTTDHTSNHITSVCHFQHFPYDKRKSVSMPRLFPTDCAQF
jgi:hypothetical protein